MPSCVDDFNIGDIGPGGGLIFKVPSTGDPHYYEIAPVDIGTATYPQYTTGFDITNQDCNLNNVQGFEWGKSAPMSFYNNPAVPSGSFNGNYGRYFGEGKWASQLIAAEPFAGTTGVPSNDINKVAAVVCETWIYGGQEDWFLPSTMELHYAHNSLYGNGFQIPGLHHTSGTGSSYYRNQYWTTGQKLNGVFKDAIEFTTGGIAGPSSNTVTLKYCHTRSVRAIRRFTPCIEYNYRYETQNVESIVPHPYSTAPNIMYSEADIKGSLSRIFSSDFIFNPNFPLGFYSVPYRTSTFGGKILNFYINDIDTNLQNVTNHFPTCYVSGTINAHINGMFHSGPFPGFNTTWRYKIYNIKEELIGDFEYERCTYNPPPNYIAFYPGHCSWTPCYWSERQRWKATHYMKSPITSNVYLDLNRHEGPFYIKIENDWIDCMITNHGYKYSNTGELETYPLGAPASKQKNIRGNSTTVWNGYTALSTWGQTAAFTTEFAQQVRSQYPFSWVCQSRCSNDPSGLPGIPKPWYPNRINPGSIEETSLIQNPNGGLNSNTTIPTIWTDWSPHLALNPSCMPNATSLCCELGGTPTSDNPYSSQAANPSSNALRYGYSNMEEQLREEKNLIFSNENTKTAFKHTPEHPFGIETPYTDNTKKQQQKPNRRTFNRKK